MLLTLGSIAAALAALVHLMIFVFESVTWRRPATWKRFGLRSQDDAETVAPMAFNQGFYNLFLALGVVIGLALRPSPIAAAGTGILIFAVASMLAASLVLVISSPRLWRAALTQGALPLIATVLLGLGLATG